MDYITLSADVVVKACTAYLNKRQERINAVQEPLIQKEMNGLFRKKTREEAIDSLSRQELFSEFNSIRNRGAYWADLADDLLQLARIAQLQKTEVNLTRESASLLVNYILENKDEREN